MRWQEHEQVIVPRIGDRVERRRAGVTKGGTVHYADELQALVKWDDGSSSSVRLDRERLRVIEPRARGRSVPEPKQSETAQSLSTAV